MSEWRGMQVLWQGQNNVPRTLWIVLAAVAVESLGVIDE